MRQFAPPFNISHFAIAADDVARAKRFYEDVFGWTITVWGPPGFYLIDTGNGIAGALQQRPEPLSGTGLRGFECTVSVENVEESVAKILAAGGRTIYPKSTIPTVGDIAKMEDTEGNSFCVVRYDSEAN